MRTSGTDAATLPYRGMAPLSSFLAVSFFWVEYRAPQARKKKTRKLRRTR